MVERLASYDPEPEAQLIAEPRRLSPLTWVAIIALGSAGVITAALWWFEPDFTGVQANDGPTASDRVAKRGRPTARWQPLPPTRQEPGSQRRRPRR